MYIIYIFHIWHYLILAMYVEVLPELQIGCSLRFCGHPPKLPSLRVSLHVGNAGTETREATVSGKQRHPKNRFVMTDRRKNQWIENCHIEIVKHRHWLRYEGHVQRMNEGCQKKKDRRRWKKLHGMTYCVNVQQVWMPYTSRGNVNVLKW